MGGSKSAHKHPPELDSPWRSMIWDKEKIEQNLRDFNLNKPDVGFVRILLVGGVGAGKSSFINSVNNAFQGRITSGALVDGTGGPSFTKKYKNHYIEGKNGSRLPFIFNNLMGLENEESGVTEVDIFNAMKGCLEEGYKFNPGSPVSSNDIGYKNNPSLEDKTSCLVNIIAADKISLISDGVIRKLKAIRQEATNLDIPQVIVMTRPDLACPLVNENIQKIYSSQKIKAKMQECSNRLGIPMNHIFPVKNYHEEIDTNDDIDVLILKAVDQIVNIAADALKIKSSV
ncbi:interferon-induced protein 44-like [Clarias gariepinus]|uniref:interferon-induced protein 44-like n=1 Tax=Clarias gariepinus TaxID=13013 RepID=UPI00234CAD50|nr:interferon-induced protein 44-like [Clarias gariepinus]XP_053332632.1 interferon-induced protein 44-like [Clarias gariepinus]XP_053332633.1 interferon-induced protein 44-like [Clarias gariepinus]